VLDQTKALFKDAFSQAMAEARVEIRAYAGLRDSIPTHVSLFTRVEPSMEGATWDEGCILWEMRHKFILVICMNCLLRGLLR
jgi:hypothetical protein